MYVVYPPLIFPCLLFVLYLFALPYLAVDYLCGDLTLPYFILAFPVSLHLFAPSFTLWISSVETCGRDSIMLRRHFILHKDRP